jgi:hypothetical protein
MIIQSEISRNIIYWTNDIPKGLYRVTVIPFKVENGAKIRCWAGLICRSEVWICSGEEWDGHAGVGARQDVIRIEPTIRFRTVGVRSDLLILILNSP